MQRAAQQHTFACETHFSVSWLRRFANRTVLLQEGVISDICDGNAARRSRRPAAMRRRVLCFQVLWQAVSRQCPDGKLLRASTPLRPTASRNPHVMAGHLQSGSAEGRCISELACQQQHRARICLLVPTSAAASETVRTRSHSQRTLPLQFRHTQVDKQHAGPRGQAECGWWRWRCPSTPAAAGWISACARVAGLWRQRTTARPAVLRRPSAASGWIPANRWCPSSRWPAVCIPQHRPQQLRLAPAWLAGHLLTATVHRLCFKTLLQV